MKKKKTSSKPGKPPAKGRIILLLAAAAVLVCAAAVWRHLAAPRIELPYLTARYAAVMDVNTGGFVYSQEMDMPRSPASLTKLMTLFLVLDDLESGALDWEDTFTVTAEQAHTQGSKYGMRPGEVFTVRQLVAGTVLSSGCDCVQCLVLMCAQDEAAFVVRMNKKAKELGMKGSGKDENKRAPMYWSDDAAYPGLCDGPADMEDVAMKFPGFEDQKADGDSIFWFVAQTIRLRSAYPAIARGTAVLEEAVSNENVCVLRKTWGEEEVLLAFNISEAPQSVDLSGLTVSGGSPELGGVLVSTAEEPALEDGMLSLPMYSVAVLKSAS